MNGYKAFYKNKTLEVYADTSLSAQEQAVRIFKAKHQHEVHVVLCEIDAMPEIPGKQVIHTPID